MDIETIGKRLQHMTVFCQRGNDTKFYLRVVGGQKQMVGVACHKGTAYLAPPFGADGYILQVGARRRESPRGGDGLVVNGMQAARGGIDAVMRVRPTILV